MAEFHKIPPRRTPFYWCVVVLVVVLFLLSVTAALHYGFANDRLDLTFYQVKSDKVVSNLRIVQLSDLHCASFGDDNADLVAEVNRLSPDLIVITGDMILRQQPTNTQGVLDLCRQLVEIAPVYYGLGNHEYAVLLSTDSTLTDDLTALGVHVVNLDYEIVTIGENTVAIGGMALMPDLAPTYAEDFLTRMSGEDCFKILLSHYPDVFESAMDDYSLDLALCGHVHGGVIRLPGLGPLYESNQGFFPTWAEGQHDVNGCNVIISRGLGQSNWVPRFNNPPELVVVDIDCY